MSAPRRASLSTQAPPPQARRRRDGRQDRDLQRLAAPPHLLAQLVDVLTNEYGMSCIGATPAGRQTSRCDRARSTRGWRGTSRHLGRQGDLVRRGRRPRPRDRDGRRQADAQPHASDGTRTASPTRSRGGWPRSSSRATRKRGATAPRRSHRRARPLAAARPAGAAAGPPTPPPKSTPPPVRPVTRTTAAAAAARMPTSRSTAPRPSSRRGARRTARAAVVRAAGRARDLRPHAAAP